MQKMLARVSRGSFGLSQYLITGKRKDSQFSRDEKDKVTSLYGDLNLFAETEKWLCSNKSYKDNYLHLTLGFSKDDMNALESVPNKDELLADLARDYIAYYTTGYDLDSEVIAYAEAHEPIIKSEHGKERLSHIHIAIALYNPQTDKQLRPPFFNLKRDDAFKSQMCEKYGLEKPVREIQREKNFLSFIGKRRARLIEFLKIKGFKNGEEVMSWLKDNNVEFRVVKTGKNHYIKIINENGVSFNLRGRGLEHLEMRTEAEKIAPTPINAPINPDVADADIGALRKEIRDEALEIWRKKRILEIDKARKAHERRQKAQENTEPCAISYQNKVFFTRYKAALKRDLKGYYIDTSKDNQTHFKAQGVDILDTGNKLTAKGSDLKSQVTLMLDIAEVKKWNLLMLNVTGSAEFKAEVEVQIAQRREKQRELQKTNKNLANEKQRSLQPQTPQNRTYTPIDSIVRERQETAKKHEHKMDIIKDFYKTAKVNVITTFLLDARFSKQYMPNLAQPIGKFYEQQGDRMLDKRTGRSKSIIDFFTKDAKVPMQTALAWLDKKRIEEIERQKEREAREKAEIDAKNKQITELEAEIDKATVLKSALQDESETLKSQKDERDKEIADIKNKIAERDKQIQAEKERQTREKAEKDRIIKEQEVQRTKEPIKKRDVFAEIEAEQKRMWQEVLEKSEREYQESLILQQQAQQVQELPPQEPTQSEQSAEIAKEKKSKIKETDKKKSKSKNYGMSR